TGRGLPTAICRSFLLPTACLNLAWRYHKSTHRMRLRLCRRCGESHLLSMRICDSETNVSQNLTFNYLINASRQRSIIRSAEPDIPRPVYSHYPFTGVAPGRTKGRC